MLKLLAILPKNLISWCFGKLAQIQLPDSLRMPLLRWYSERYGANIAEAELKLEAYQSLSAFFSRNLKPGLRPIADRIVSPVDGRLVRTEAIRAEQFIQAKGISYPLAELLASGDYAEKFREGSFATLYLAPGDYHKIHSPCDGHIACHASTFPEHFGL